VFIEQSELTVHSGRQLGGYPMKVGKHVQIGWLFTFRHWLFGPQGEGEHGFCITGSCSIIWWHVIKAFPVIPGGQWHIGIWL